MRNLSATQPHQRTLPSSEDRDVIRSRRDGRVLPPCRNVAGVPPGVVLVGGFLGLFAVCGMLGAHGAAAARPIFVLGAAALGWFAWRSSPAHHVQLATALFAFAPFLRRIVDQGCGYDMSGLMLAGPLLAILPPVLDLRRLHRRAIADCTPHLLFASCVGYAALISAFIGDAADLPGPLLKIISPLLYGVWVQQQVAAGQDMLRPLARIFAVIAPIMGLYAIYQYADPPEWDRLWMIFAHMDSIGMPRAYEVRTFSTMNSPGSFATFTACALLLFGFCARRWWAGFLALPVAIGLSLSLFRTAWLALAASVAFCAIYPATRRRAGVVAMLLLAAAIIALNSAQFGDVLSKRLDSLTTLSNDGSLAARMAEFTTYYAHANEFGLGEGLAAMSKLDNPIGVLDGTTMQLFVGMGLFVGLICIASLFWALLRALARIQVNAGPGSVVAAAVVLGELLQMPFTGTIDGEMGFLFWALVGIASAQGAAAPATWRSVSLRSADRSDSVATGAGWR